MMKQYLTKQNLPMVVVIGLIVWAWLSLISALIGKLF
jgi:hypothetical protein